MREPTLRLHLSLNLALDLRRRCAEMGGNSTWINQLWQEMRPRALEKVAALLQAIEMNRLHGLTPSQRADTTRLAQQLAGSLGSYGFAKSAEATAAAAELEEVLSAESPIDQDRADSAARRLRDALEA